MCSKDNFKLEPTNDYVFKRIFGSVGNEDITSDLLEKILKKKYDKIDLSKNPIILADVLSGKSGILDVIIQADEKELLNWCKFMLSPNEMEAKIMEENKYIKKAKEELEKISQDEAERELAYRREKAIRDQNAVRASGYNEGKEAGKEEGKKEIIQKMLDNGLDAEAIVKITGLTQEEINNILK